MSSQKAAIRALPKEKSKRKSSEDNFFKHKHKRHRSDKDGLALVDDPIPEDQTASPPAQTLTVGASSKQVIDVSADEEQDVPFVPSWSILTKDSALGDHNVCREMVLKGVLPKGCAQLNACPNSTITTCTYDMITSLSCYAGEAALHLERTTLLYDEEKAKTKRLEALFQKRDFDLDKLGRVVAEADSENASLKARLAKVQEEFEAAKNKWVEQGSELFLNGFNVCKKAESELMPDFDVEQLEVPDEEEGEMWRSSPQLRRIGYRTTRTKIRFETTRLRVLDISSLLFFQDLF